MWLIHHLQKKRGKLKLPKRKKIRAQSPSMMVLLVLRQRKEPKTRVPILRLLRKNLRVLMALTPNFSKKEMGETENISLNFLLNPATGKKMRMKKLRIWGQITLNKPLSLSEHLRNFQRISSTGSLMPFLWKLKVIKKLSKSTFLPRLTRKLNLALILSKTGISKLWTNF